MNYVLQTKFGADDGNCFAACLASIFDLSIDEVPDLQPDTWRAQLEEFLRPYGLTHMTVFPGQGLVPRNALMIAGGTSPRDPNVAHGVVWASGACQHDPHPTGAGLDGSPTDWLVFVARDPGLLRGALKESGHVE